VKRARAGSRIRPCSGASVATPIFPLSCASTTAGTAATFSAGNPHPTNSRRKHHHSRVDSESNATFSAPACFPFVDISSAIHPAITLHLPIVRSPRNRTHHIETLPSTPLFPSTLLGASVLCCLTSLLPLCPPLPSSSVCVRARSLFLLHCSHCCSNKRTLIKYGYLKPVRLCNKCNASCFKADLLLNAVCLCARVRRRMHVLCGWCVALCYILCKCVSAHVYSKVRTPSELQAKLRVHDGSRIQLRVHTLSYLGMRRRRS